jgi:hypothetical protein
MIRNLVARWLEYWGKESKYPEGFGKCLKRILESLSYSDFQYWKDHRLLAVEEIEFLRGAARKGDTVDLECVLQVVEYKLWIPRGSENIDEKLENLVRDLSEDALVKTVDEPLDIARASFRATGIIVESHEEFLHSIEAFYSYLTDAEDSSSHLAVKQKAWELVEEAFAKEGGTAAARAETKIPVRGGLRFVLDSMTECLKRRRRKARMEYVFLSQIASLDSEQKIAFVRAFVVRFKNFLPEEMLDEPPEKYANQLQLLLAAFLDFRTRLGSLVRIL